MKRNGGSQPMERQGAGVFRALTGFEAVVTGGCSDEARSRSPPRPDQRPRAPRHPMINQTPGNTSRLWADVSNETGSLLCLRVEPWALDHWMRPGEVFTVATRADQENAPSNVVVHGQGISV
jgi:hypothetical protein